jgi:hypothetical protein
MDTTLTLATLAIVIALGLVGVLVVVIDTMLFTQTANAAAHGRCPTPAKEITDGHINPGWAATQLHCS